MTALVDDTFRVLAAARQRDRDRVRSLLTGMPAADLDQLTGTLTALIPDVLAEHARRSPLPEAVPGR